MITRVKINLSGTLHISPVPYPCLKCGVPLWDRRTEAPHCGKPIMLLNSLTPIFTPLRLALSSTIITLYTSAVMKVPRGAERGFQAIPYRTQVFL
jgi:hypothetical protein